MERDIRVVGKPQGVEILYIEDYVYSFLRIAIQEKKYRQMEVVLLGSEKTENQKHYYYVSGVVFDEEEKERFEGLELLGTALITYSQEEHLEISLKRKKDKCINFKDYYIYYEENEKMKNYMLSFASVTVEEIKLPHRVSGEGAGIIIKYLMAVCIMAYVIISMNHYGKLERIGEQAIYVIETISQQKVLPQKILQEDTFYTP